MPLIDVNGTRLNIEDTGAPAADPDAPVLVFGHGLLFSTTMWRDQIAALRDRFRCIAIDWRGQGQSPASDVYDMDTLAEDAIGVIEHLGVGPVHFLGLSMGGFVGQRVAARRPDLVRTLTLIDTSAGPEDPEKIKKYRLLATLYGLVGLRPLMGQVAPIMFTKAFLATPAGKEVARTWQREVGTQDRTATKGAIRGVTDRLPVVDELDRITAPTLVVVGSEDPATPVAKAEVIAERIPGARLEILPGVGHVSTLEAPDAVTAAITRFLSEHAG